METGIEGIQKRLQRTEERERVREKVECKRGKSVNRPRGDKAK